MISDAQHHGVPVIYCYHRPNGMVRGHARCISLPTGGHERIAVDMEDGTTIRRQRKSFREVTHNRT